MEFRINDFFCGAGGMGLGFKQVGFRTAGAYDFDKYAVESYGRNVSPKVKLADITTMSATDLSYADVWAFGFPCVDLSVAGRQEGIILRCLNEDCKHEWKPFVLLDSVDGNKEFDKNCPNCGTKSKPKTRSALFFEVMRLLEETEQISPDLMPKIIMAENVKGLTPYLPTLRKEYEARGYKMYHTIYNSKFGFIARDGEYRQGVPQNRERYFVVGVHNSIQKEFVFPEQVYDFVPKLSSILETDVDEKFFISDEKALKIIEIAKENLFKEVEAAGEIIKVCDIPKEIIKDNERQRRVYSTEGVSPTLLGRTDAPKIFVKTTLPIGEEETLKVSLEDKLGVSSHFRSREFRGQGLKTVCPTLCARDYKDPKNLWDFNTWRVRKLTPREYARLQQFPDHYEQVVSNSQFYKQMGNAVTVGVARILAETIQDFLS